MWTDENGGSRIQWCNASFTTSMTHALQGMLSYFYCLAFSYGRAKTIRIRCGCMRIFFENGRKNLHFQKYPDTCWRGLIEPVRICCLVMLRPSPRRVVWRDKNDCARESSVRTTPWPSYRTSIYFLQFTLASQNFTTKIWVAYLSKFATWIFIAKIRV